ncbi:beta-galactosidase small subunit [Lactobacillus sp. ESL0731]|uniref:beta-galactosidase small subunit n=1 Tax=unclassified Lactobacillus TaxID=2620435 RepID=UPI0023F8D4A7|nr:MULTISPECIES: beta-galactosidase small subunit [unclassified Lactobacillus]WEV51080.1 beta-galactosidase small subunit [Lactobacillus sp. ESL0700]WEV62209.1 beta-galactosidase small subunit [Lactobacillus sp. ESL0731]
MGNTKLLNIVYTAAHIGINGENFSYQFNIEKGGPDSLVFDNKEWLYRIPKPIFWRATTDNDRGNEFSIKSAQWLGADLFTKCIKCKIKVDEENIPVPYQGRFNDYPLEARQVELSYLFQTPTNPKTEVRINYLVNSSGAIEIDSKFYGKKGLPELPVFGLQFVMPTEAVGYEYEGLSGEIYPDRMEGAATGKYLIEGLPLTKYLVPQDCQVRMQTERLEILRQHTLNNADHEDNLFKLDFLQLDKPFAFSCLPYTAEEIENATHIEELPVKRRTVVSILGAVRGVGGINSWGAEVDSKYRILSDKDIEFKFVISGNIK